MRVATVVGRVTLSRRIDEIAGGRLLIVAPHALEELAGVMNADAEGTMRPSSADMVVAYDELSPGQGALIALAEGREAANGILPRVAPLDAYVAAVLEDLTTAGAGGGA